MLKTLSLANGVSGAEGEVRDLVIKAIANHVDSYRIDTMGNVLAKEDPRSKIWTYEYDAAGNCMEGYPIVIDCERSFVSGRSGRLVACLGLKNVLVVDTEDALLVADLDKSQDIRKVVDALKEKGKEEVL